MKTSTMLLCVALALTGKAFGDGSTAQGSASVSTPNAQANAAGTAEINATLSKPVDARKAKPGDRVTATSDQDVKTADGIRIERGSKLIGHVTMARALGKSSSGGAEASVASMLAIVFDTATLKNGTEVALGATIQAVAAAQSEASLAAETGGADTSTGGLGASSMRGARGGLIGGGLSAAGGPVGGVDRGVNGAARGVAGASVHSAGAVGGFDASGTLTSGSKGVFGIQGLDIASSSAGSAEGSLITSSTRNVRLDAGTKMLLSARAGVAGTTAASDGTQVKPAQ